MGIEIARHAGFCMGVRRAVDQTLNAAESGDEIVTFGELVHNPQVIEKLEAMGVYAIHSCEQAAGKTVIIRSHGVSPRRNQTAGADGPPGDRPDLSLCGQAA